MSQKTPGHFGAKCLARLLCPREVAVDDITSLLSSHKLLGNVRIILILRTICNSDYWSQKIIYWDIV